MANSQKKDHFGAHMNLTPQQLDVASTELQCGESLLVESGAGTGKTTCLIEFCRRNPAKKILYLCFNNKAVREARSKYKKEGITNTTTSTLHGLAKSKKKLYEAKGKFQTKISPKEIQQHLQCSLIQAWDIQRTIKNFCESSDDKPLLTHVPPPEDPHANPEKTLTLSQKLWEDIKNPENPFPVSYDEYLKIYAQENPHLPYDYILLDEAQDSNPISLHLLETQKKHTRLVLIGDRHQAIYSWRGAKNAMESWKTAHQKNLTESFRFGPEIAKMANLILTTFQKSPLRLSGHQKIDRLGPLPENKKHTLISRTNATLFETALDHIKENKKFHFAGTTEESNWDPTEAYKFQEALDIFYLWAHRKREVRSPQIRVYESYYELKKTAEGKPPSSPGDPELKSLCRLVEKYGHRLPNLLKQIVRNSTSPTLADIELSTAHRAKGLEWENVRLANDFTSLLIDKKGEIELAQAADPTNPTEGTNIEEFNLLYVAVTRAKKHLQPNQEILKLLRSPLLPPSIPRPAVQDIPTPKGRKYPSLNSEMPCI
jgi:F-box protein 18 (helicase)